MQNANVHFFQSLGFLQRVSSKPLGRGIHSSIGYLLDLPGPPYQNTAQSTNEQIQNNETWSVNLLQGATFTFSEIWNTARILFVRLMSPRLLFPVLCDLVLFRVTLSRWNSRTLVIYSKLMSGHQDISCTFSFRNDIQTGFRDAQNVKKHAAKYLSVCDVQCTSAFGRELFLLKNDKIYLKMIRYILKW